MRIWVTGIGVVSPLARGAAATMDRLIEGERGQRPLELFVLPYTVGSPAPVTTGSPGGAPEPPKPVSAPLAIEVPTLEVQYKVGWAGDIYSEEKGDRQFVGIVVNFDVSMRIPDQADAFDFSLEVTPPEHFTVEYSSPFGGAYGGRSLPGLGAPSEGQVYDVMASRAFDQLTEKLRVVFFRPGSKAFEGAPGAGDDPEDGPKPKGLSPRPRLPEPSRRKGTQL
jgi:hypothetical protein